MGRQSVSQFAENLLFSKSLSEKLAFPESIAFNRPSENLLTAITPKSPARPINLTFGHESAFKSKRVEFPRTKDIENRLESRGIVLHFFMNHELLAIELMALALLKFPDMPIGLKRSIVNSIREEQEHCELYLKQMKRYGTDVGSVPVNGYFWNSLSKMTSLSHFLSGMSLTFEQANLDYSLYFQKLFKKVGDEETAKVLQTVYEDELKHVRLGVEWSNRLYTPGGDGLFEHYQNSLLDPLSPARAKGIIFDKESRRKVGLDSTFIDKLDSFTRSKSRPGDVWVFNLDCEQRLIQKHRSGLLDQKIIRKFIPSLSALMKPNDALLVSFDMSVEDALALKKSCLVDIEVIGPSNYSSLSSRIEAGYFRGLKSWGWSEAWLDDLTKLLSKKIPALAEIETRGAIEGDKLHSKCEQALWRKEILFQLSTKAKFVSLADEKSFRVLSCYKAIVGFAGSLLEKGYSDVLIKAPFGCSGKNQKKVNLNDLATAPVKGWVEKTISNAGSVLVEGFHEIVAEFSLCTLGDGDEGFALFGGNAGRLERSTRKVRKDRFNLLKLEVDKNRQYVGHQLTDVDKEIKKSFSFAENTSEAEVGRQYSESKVLINEAAKLVSKQLNLINYLGPFALDIYLFKGANGRIFLNPFSELNLRFTFSHVALAYAKKKKVQHFSLT